MTWQKTVWISNLWWKLKKNTLKKLIHDEAPSCKANLRGRRLHVEYCFTSEVHASKNSGHSNNPRRSNKVRIGSFFAIIFHNFFMPLIEILF